MYQKKLLEKEITPEKTIIGVFDNIFLFNNNKEEERHCCRVSQLCKNMGKALSLSEQEIAELGNVGLFHDIGKTAINKNLLNKQEKLSEKEWKEIKRHPTLGYVILSSINGMKGIAKNILCHHERWDGQGYPNALKGEKIPLYARISAVADTYDTISNDRGSQRALSKKEAIKELKKNSGTQFDPEMVKVFLEKVVML